MRALQRLVFPRAWRDHSGPSPSGPAGGYPRMVALVNNMERRLPPTLLRSYLVNGSEHGIHRKERALHHGIPRSSVVEQNPHAGVQQS